jgi:type IV secretory pathway VirB2 component (pilin)
LTISNIEDPWFCFLIALVSAAGVGLALGDRQWISAACIFVLVVIFFSAGQDALKARREKKCE